MEITKRLARYAFQWSPQPLRHFVRDRLPDETGRRIRRALTDSQIREYGEKNAALRLETKLWGGFSETALRELDELKRDEEIKPRDRSLAAWALARWYKAWGDPQRSLDEVALARRLAALRRPHVGHVLLEAELLLQIQRYDEARQLVEEALEQRPDNPHLTLALANTYAPEPETHSSEGDAKRLELVNRLVCAPGFAPVVKKDSGRPLGIDNLHGEPGPSPVGRDDQARVTVIVPAYKSADTLNVALDSLLAQTWENLEIIVVDDCSPDETAAIAEAVAARDARVRVLRQSENGGAYSCRNAGLAVATGEFVTTHDADDWSHPQKIEAQVTRLVRDPNCVGNVTHWVRTYPHIFFRGTSRPSGQLVQWNHSSFMTRRALMEELGGWDEVRVTGDTEFFWRLVRYTGGREPESLFEGVPLSFALEDTGSLTRQSLTHVRTMYHGIRREYREAADHWHHSAEPEALRLPRPPRERPFPAPGFILPKKEECHECDLLVVMDFNIGGGAFVSTMNYINAALADGKSVAVFHWRRYDLDVRKRLNPQVRQMAQDGKLRIVTPGEQVRAEVVLVGYPPILQHPIDMAPTVEFNRLLVVVNQMASRLFDGGDPQYDPERTRETLLRVFGTEGQWVPISGLVRRLMQEDGRYPAPGEIWTPLVDADTWCSEPLSWRGAEKRRPTLGRHGRDHYTKWPSSAEAIAAAYCAGQRCRVELLGGADEAMKLIGRRPRNWKVHRFGSMDAREFLGRLDFFIHYPHENYIEECGRSVIEAMAAGIPVILPPVFEQTFGDGAVYAEPQDVWRTIAELWGDEDAYLERARAGHAFVRERAGWDQLRRRLAW